MSVHKKSYEQLEEENQRLQEELYVLKGGVHEVFSSVSREYPNLKSHGYADKLKYLGIIFKSLESRKYTLNEQLEALDSVDDGIAIFTGNGKLMFSNRSFPKLFKLEPERLIDAHWRDLFAGEILAPIKEFLRDLSPHYPIHKEVIIPFKNSQLFLNSSVYPLENGTYLVNVKDVTTEKEKLFTIQEQAFLLRSSGEFMAVCSNSFEFSFLNEAGRKLFAISEGWIYKKFVDFIKNKSMFERDIVPKVLQKNGWIGELMIQTKDREFPVNCEVIPFEPTLKSEGGFYVILRDITERKEAIRKLVDAKNEAENNMKVRQQFMANMSHEIRTPMNAIIGLSNLLVDSGLSGKKAEFANSIKLSADNLLVIINDILDISKIESGKLAVEHVKFDINEMLLGVKSIFEHKIESNGSSFEFKIDSRIPSHLIGDPTRLNQILLNLISNAEKFTKEGTISVNTRLVKESKNKVRLQFCVKDTGIGIAKENLDKIFQAFTQESDNTTRLYGGTGLGLAIVKELVGLQDGKIWVESRINKGSSFFVEIEYGTTELIEDGIDIFNQGFFESKLKAARIIMAEDYPMNRLLAKSLFEKWGLSLTMVNNGKELLNDLNTNSYDIILMDIQMPELDGLEATRILRKRGLVTPVIAITAHAFKEEQIQCAKAGMNDFLSKPFNEKELKEKLATFLNLHPEDLSKAAIEEFEEGANSTLEYFNLDYINELGAGDEGFVKEMLEMFISQVPDLLNQMILSLNDGRKLDMAKFAHTIQSSFVMIERKDVKADLKKLEIWGKGEDSIENPIGELSSILQKASLIIKSVADYLGEPINIQFHPIEVLMNVDELQELTFNFSKLEELGEGDLLFKKEMITLFISQTSTQIESIKELLKSKSFQKIGLIAHNMIASFDLIGCETLITYSRRVEEACFDQKETDKLVTQINDYLGLTKLSIHAVERKGKSEGIIT